jgi:DNA-directed RNA polymerase subunit RPC12/RpoP
MIELHNRCHKPVLFTEVSKGYYAQCPECDEDVFSFEVEE